MCFLSMLECEVCYVESEIVSVKLLRETYFVKQIAFISCLLQGANHRKYVGCSSKYE
jgi:hypothetical protein